MASFEIYWKPRTGFKVYILKLGKYEKIIYSLTFSIIPQPSFSLSKHIMLLNDPKQNRLLFFFFAVYTKKSLAICLCILLFSKFFCVFLFSNNKMSYKCRSYLSFHMIKYIFSIIPIFFFFLIYVNICCRFGDNYHSNSDPLTGGYKSINSWVDYGATITICAGVMPIRM